MTPEEYAHGFDARLAGFLREAAKRSPAFRKRVETAGLDLDAATVDGLTRIAVLTKDDLLSIQMADRPFGGLLADEARVRRIFQSPGPLYEPELDHADHWRWAPALEAAGFEAGDIVLNAFGYHLSPAGAMFEEGARALGCVVFPAGVGSMDLQVQACLDVGVTAFIGLPSYLKALLEKAETLGTPLRLSKAFVTAEPFPPSLRGWLEERIPTVRQGYGTAEAGNLGYECESAEGFHVPADALVEVCDLTTGEALWGGQEGQVVVTLFDADYPLVRFGTGDLSRFMTEPCSCGRPTPRLAGWLGRAGDAVKVRGMFLHPRQAVKVMEGADGVQTFRFVVERIEHRDLLRCEVVPMPGADVGAVVANVAERIRSGLRFRAAVDAVDSLPEGPVIDDRRTWD